MAQVRFTRDGLMKPRIPGVMWADSWPGVRGKHLILAGRNLTLCALPVEAGSERPVTPGTSSGLTSTHTKMYGCKRCLQRYRRLHRCVRCGERIDPVVDGPTATIHGYCCLLP